MLVALCAVAEAKPTPPAPIVVIDPGHGGSNLGATGGGGALREKQVTLAIARQVQAALAARGIDAVLTRDDDRTLTLRQRLARAEAEAADAFVSIHCNASPSRSQRGYETYVLTPTGVDVDARALRTDVAAPRPEVDPTVAAMLDDVERGAAQWDAAELAVAMQRRLRAVRGPDGDRGVRQDAQHVLLGATMPAVLVEVGFIDHPAEGRELVDPAVQDQLAGAIAQAIASRLDR
ncbi:MAG: N-acetylmuramoyl-L-alanine amidase [Deltaproteobacteria bacterium]|nr:N-acetylmuramoyl-L-alanine amidase [Deltaproteobacteria bacterium]